SPAWGAFAEDSFKWKPNVTLQLGFRYDWNSTPSEADNRFVIFDPSADSLVQIGTNGFGQPFHTNNKNFQPRLGIVWDPFSNGRTIVRSGYAILTDQPVTGIVTGLNSNPPFTVPLIFGGPGTIALTSAITQAGAAGLAPNATNLQFDNPYVQSYNLNVEQKLANTLGLTVAYVGSKGTHLRIARNLNQRIDGGVRPFPTLSASSPIDPGAKLGNITEIDSGGTSNYNALWVTLNKQTSHGFQFSASYTYSKSLDDNSLSSQGIILQDSNDLRNNYGPSDFDVRNRFVISGFYELPFKDHRLTEGWQLGIISQAQSGSPLNLVTGVSGFTGTTGGGSLRPDAVGPT
ncbi:MAG: TonB-dependent receptor domain-containing protein, partial [Blastocatellia bacterium]